MTEEELKPIDVSKYTVIESGNVIKDNLKQEAEEYANNLVFVFETDIVQRIVRERVRLALIDVLEPREKQIAELEEKLKHAEENCINKTCIVFKDKEDCVAKLLELEAQLEREKNLNQCLSDHNEQLRELIEKMKCCGNCCVGDKVCYVRTQEHVNICPSWKLKEIKEK